MKITLENGSVINVLKSRCATRGSRSKYIKWLKIKENEGKLENDTR